MLHRLAAEGIPLPDGWTMVQDHVRRGVVVRVDGAFDPEQVVTWALRAASALCPVPLTGGWLADHLSWVLFFAATAAAALPGLLLLVWMTRRFPVRAPA